MPTVLLACPSHLRRPTRPSSLLSSCWTSAAAARIQSLTDVRSILSVSVLTFLAACSTQRPASARARFIHLPAGSRLTLSSSCLTAFAACSVQVLMSLQAQPRWSKRSWRIVGILCEALSIDVSAVAVCEHSAARAMMARRRRFMTRCWMTL
ncbi:hypothetical protein BAUCODRAFT_372604 [Baudoinia panamericana UAMH 10762]|uniref:Uncharacterized protein n=1 Tax=Baudoinia panamericana (strain UAMH 10762) TaxID=717646 RepID=M2LZZ1_BAUPA|nr:uncharacterized protein BAUCODRAFT_372604 [Baudoinia panamericana UAMH 10762]EMD00293.1 hypothetical protein BAUCODRAFT_372604 [Baudoinia panamericana UAMH 10762]